VAGRSGPNERVLGLKMYFFGHGVLYRHGLGAFFYLRDAQHDAVYVDIVL
jgi:hypothetical protein